LKTGGGRDCSVHFCLLLSLSPPYVFGTSACRSMENVEEDLPCLLTVPLLVYVLWLALVALSLLPEILCENGGISSFLSHLGPLVKDMWKTSGAMPVFGLHTSTWLCLLAGLSLHAVCVADSQLHLRKDYGIF